MALNLAINLVTVVSAFLTRAGTLSLAPIIAILPVVAAIIAGAVSAAYLGTALVHRISEQLLERFILVLLVVIGAALIVEAFLPQQVAGLLPDVLPVRLIAAVLFGLGIGLVSSLLGVAGGELIIPTLLFTFGVDVKAAGTASLFISLPTVVIGVLRHRRRGAFEERQDLTKTVVPMGVGSVIGAAAGGLLVSLVPAAALKLILGTILIISAVRIFRK